MKKLPLAIAHWTLIIASLALPTGCSADTSTTSTAPATAPTTQSSDPAPMPFDTTDMTLKGKNFKIEVAETEAQEQRGLMYRTSMPDDHGMLFIFDKPDIINFWMHNTRIPLDIIFLDKDGKVLVIHNRQPMDDTGMGPDSPAQYVIELNLGAADKLGLKKGDKVEIPKKYLKN